MLAIGLQLELQFALRYASKHPGDSLREMYMFMKQTLMLNISIHE
jgi:hypothetical protein